MRFRPRAAPVLRRDDSTGRSDGSRGCPKILRSTHSRRRTRSRMGNRRFRPKDCPKDCPKVGTMIRPKSASSKGRSTRCPRCSTSRDRATNSPKNSSAMRDSSARGAGRTHLDGAASTDCSSRSSRWDSTRSEQWCACGLSGQGDLLGLPERPGRRHLPGSLAGSRGRNPRGRLGCWTKSRIRRNP